MWKTVGTIYLFLSGAITLFLFCWMAFEDIRMYRQPWRKGSSKFGYNLKWNGIGWLMLLGCMPVINIVVALYLFLPKLWLGKIVELYFKIFFPERLK
jgi:hypothetical protein